MTVSKQVKEAGLLRRNQLFYGALLGGLALALGGIITGFILLGDSWFQLLMAGALGIRLSGPRVYDGVPVEERWVGEGRSELTAKDIRNALKLYRTACAVQIAVLVLIVLGLRLW